MPRRRIDSAYKEKTRSAYYAARGQDERNRLLHRAMKETGFSYGGLMRSLDLGVRTHSLTEKQSERIDYLNSLGKAVWEFSEKQSKGFRKIYLTVAFRHLKKAEVLPEWVTYTQVSEAIRRQNLKNKSGSLFRRFQRTEPLAMIQVDFTRSVYLEHIKEGETSKLRITHSKGANAKRERVWIAAAIDDSSRVAYARYFLATGESSRHAQRFVLKTFAGKQRINPGTGEITVLPLLQGIPSKLYTDRGSAFRNTAFRSGIRKLGILHIIGSMETNTQGVKKDSPNKQGRGKVERFIRTIKDDFETNLFLQYKAGTTFTVREINTLFKEWLMKVNKGNHPENRSLIKWDIFSPVVEKATYPEEEAELLFTTSLFCKVIKRQIRVASGVWCKVPDEVNTGETIEIVILGENYYAIIDGKRVILQVISKKAGKNEEQEIRKDVNEFATDYLEGVRLRSALNEEIEKRTRHAETIGTLSEKNADEIEEFLNTRRQVKEIRLFAQSIVARSKETGNTTVGEEGIIIPEESAEK